MATNKYQLEIKSHGSNAVFQVQYKNGKFFRLEKVKGKFANKEQKSGLFHVVPENEKNIERINTDFKDRVSFILLNTNKTTSLHSSMLGAFMEFYEEKNGLKARINGTEGRALKMIIKYFNDLGMNEELSLELWKAILSNWDKLDKFYQNQMELRQINSNLNIILRQLKNGGFNKETQSNVSFNEMEKALQDRFSS